MKLILNLTDKDVCLLKAHSKGLNNYNGTKYNWKQNAYNTLISTIENGGLVFESEEEQRIFQKEYDKLIKLLK